MEDYLMNAKLLRSAEKDAMVPKRKPVGCGEGLQYLHIILCVSMIVVFLTGGMISQLYAQSYPDKPIRFIMPMAPGGVTDIVGRIVSQKITEQLGKPLVLEHRSGAGGNVGLEHTAHSRPDGYTIVLGSGSLSISPAIYKKLKYDPINDLSPVSMTANVPAVVVIHPSQPFRTLKELVEYAKANPGKLHFGSSGVGTANHLTGELLANIAKIDLKHVPYKGAGPALTALMSGEIQIMMTAFSSALQHINSGRFRALAMCSRERSPSLPDVPTAKEAGIDGYEVSNWYGILAPGGTPRDIINRLNGAWVKSMAMSDTKQLMRNAGVEPLLSTPEEMGEFIRSEISRWSKVVEDAKIAKID
jgi:tripartite-type tricarboxylate transporter receptor subunit TctC